MTPEILAETRKELRSLREKLARARGNPNVVGPVFIGMNPKERRQSYLSWLSREEDRLTRLVDLYDKWLNPPAILNPYSDIDFSVQTQVLATRRCRGFRIPIL